MAPSCVTAPSEGTEAGETSIGISPLKNWGRARTRDPVLLLVVFAS
jgi:hypothetical protein